MMGRQRIYICIRLQFMLARVDTDNYEFTCTAIVNTKVGESVRFSVEYVPIRHCTWAKAKYPQGLISV